MSYTFDELIEVANITDTEKHARFQYSVLDVEFDDPAAQEAFDNLSDKVRFFEILSENYSEESRERDV